MYCRKHLTEEFIQIDTEVVNVTVLADERDSLPASVGTLPDIPCIASNGNIGSLERADGLDAIMRSE